MQYIVTTPHRSEYPNPIQLRKGDVLVVGENTKARKVGMIGSSAPSPAKRVDGFPNKSLSHSRMAQVVPWKTTSPKSWTSIRAKHWLDPGR